MGSNDIVFILCIPIALVIVLFRWLFSMSEEEEDVEEQPVVTKVVYIRPRPMKRHAQRVFDAMGTEQATPTSAPVQGAVNLW